MNELQKLIDDFYSLKIKERTGSTFLEIAKCPHLENVWSNILAFYINPNNEHNLFDCIINSVFASVKSDITINNLKNVRVKTEYPTIKGNRIDIVVFADTFILGIENKVDAALYNDLEDYSNTLEDLAKPQNLQVLKIVLSKYRYNVSNGFFNITYSDLLLNIKKSIGCYTDFCDTKYLTFLFDFLKNIENNINSQSMENNLEVVHFFQNNIDKINRLIDYHNKFNADLVQKLNTIHSMIHVNDIPASLNSQHKQIKIAGPGRWTYQGKPLIKYNILVDDISLFFEVAITDYKFSSYYWFAHDKYRYIKPILENKGIETTYYKYEESAENISKVMAQQITSIITFLINEQQ